MSLFLGWFAVTVVLLLAALVAGRRRARRTHVAFVAGTVLALGATIVQAERMGRGLAFDPTLFRIHMVLAFTTLGVVALQAVLGLRAWRRPEARRAHGIGAVAFLVLVVLTTVAGTLMWRSARPRAEEESASTIGGFVTPEKTGPDRAARPALDPAAVPSEVGP